jgi:surface carbohydrate biosynthesis protein
MRGLPHLIIPVETAARELDAKLLLSLFASHTGMNVTLGNKALLNLRIADLEPGIYLSHNFNSGRDRIISLAKKLGHTLVAWDEEGLVWINEDIYRKRRINLRALENLDLLILWGLQQEKAVAPVLGVSGPPTLRAGNPRADLLRPELRSLYTQRASELKAELGNFILVNSNFGWINHALARDRSGPVLGHLEAVSEKSGFPLAYLKHRFDIYLAFVETLPAIAARFPHRKIVVRPHPSESRDGWVKATGNLPNVLVRYDNELVPWLLAAGHIVQNGCTTAVEAALLGRAAISYRPYIVAEHEIPQPHRVSHVAQQKDELLELLSQPSLTDRVPSEFTSALDEMVTGRAGALASERIVNELVRLVGKGGKGPSAAKRLMAKVAGNLRRVEKSVARHIPGSPSQAHYIAQKFPPMPASAIATRLKEQACCVGLPAPEVTAITDRIFRIAPAVTTC